jgi:alkylation response protein AidB-like acyl-CoA dehydrogenase
MDPELSAEESMLLSTCRQFLDRECPTSLIREMEGLDRSFEPRWWRQAAEIGWISALCANGGGDPVRGLPSLAVIAEECGRHVAPGPLIPTNVVALALAETGGSLAETWLGRLRDGEWTAAWSFMESPRRALSDHFETALQPARHRLTLTGMKRYAEAAGQAELMLISASSEDGIVHAVVPTDTPGIKMNLLEGVDLGRRYYDVTFDGVPLEEAVTIHDPAGRMLRRYREVALAAQAAETAGALSRVFEMTLDNLMDRYSFGRPLASYQALKHEMANLKLELEACLAIATAAVAAVAEQDDRSAELVSAAKAYQGMIGTAFVQRCIQLHGGMGVTWEHDLHLFLRRVMDNRVMFGGPDEHLDCLAVLTGAEATPVPA